MWDASVGGGVRTDALAIAQAAGRLLGGTDHNGGESPDVRAAQTPGGDGDALGRRLQSALASIPAAPAPLRVTA
jgi:hypothetical protein